MAKNNSILADLREFFKDEAAKNYFSHVIVAMEVSEKGTPIGAAVKLTCSPILALGVIDLLHEKLSEARDAIMKELDDYEKANMSVDSSVNSINAESSIDALFDDVIKSSLESISNEDKSFFADCQKRALDAIMNNDEDTLKAIVKEMREYVEKKTKGGDLSDDDFDINNFKGGF